MYHEEEYKAIGWIKYTLGYVGYMFQKHVVRRAFENEENRFCYNFENQENCFRNEAPRVFWMEM